MLSARPMMPNMYIYNICKWRLGSGGGGEWVVKAKENIKSLTKIVHFPGWSFLLYTNCINTILYRGRTIVFLN